MGLQSAYPTRRLALVWGWIVVIGIVVCVCFGGIAVLTSVLGQEEQDDFRGSQITYGLTLLASDFDPHSGSASEIGIPLYSVYDTLIYRDPNTLEFVAGLAERWEVSPNGLIYTFYLRQDVIFHDNTPFNADAVGVTFDRILNNPTGKAYALLGGTGTTGQLFFATYAIPKDENNYTFQIFLNEPYAPLLDALSQPYFGIASPTALANTPNKTYQFHQVGTGPYKMIEFIPGDRILLERNPDYRWGPEFYQKEMANAVDRIEFRFLVDSSTRRLALEGDEVAIVGEVPPDDAQILLSERGEFKVERQTIPGQPLQFYFNTQRFPTDNQLFRQALLYITDRGDIVDRVFFRTFSPIAYGPLSAGTLYYDAGMADFYPHDPTTARQLFNAIGIQDTDGDGILENNGEPIVLKIVIAGWGFLPDVATLIQSQWRSIGIDVEIEQVPNFPALLEAAALGDYHLIALNDFGTDPSLINRYYLSDGDRNWIGYQDLDLDLWLRQAVTISDAEQRRQLYSLIQRRIMDQALILPIRDYVNLVGYRDELSGLRFSPQGWWPLLHDLTME